MATQPAAHSNDALRSSVYLSYAGLSRTLTKPKGIPYETGEQLLTRQSGRLRDLADLMNTGEVAYAVVALIDSVENAPTGTGPRPH